MILPSHLLGIFFALSAALVWGGSDFGGGLAARRYHQFQVLVLSSLSGMLLLVVAALLWGEALPALRDVFWAALAGASVALGLASLYRALAVGDAASVAPSAAVIGAALPVGFSILTRGLPAAVQLVGFTLAFLGIWLVSRTAPARSGASRPGFLLACLAGISFGIFFILIAQVEPDRVFIPLFIARSVSFLVGLLLMRFYRLPLPALSASPVALLAGALDATGDIFYLLARQFTRLDVAAVLVSLYPALTVVLTCIFLKEKVSRSQAAGVGICLAAIVLITI